MRLIRIGEAADMLGISAQTLRRRSEGRNHADLFGYRLKVYRMDIRLDAERRFDADEIHRLLARLQRD